MIHETAQVDAGARIGQGVRIGPYAVVEADTTIGDGCEIRSHAVVKRYTEMGRENRVHEGAVLGGEPQDLAFDGSPSRLSIGDRNVFREGVTVHRATRPGAATLIGSDCFLMANAHVAHDCVIGDRAILANDALLSGHIQVGERAFVSDGEKTESVNQLLDLLEKFKVGSTVEVTYHRDGKDNKVNVKLEAID